MIDILFHVFFFIAVIYLLLLLGLYMFQRHLIFHPEGKLEHPEFYELSEIAPLQLITADALTITAWHKPPQNNDPILVYFHGNRGHLGDRSKKLEMLSHHRGLLGISYRGFSGSHGIASEEGLYRDARAAISYLHLHYPGHPIILYGESLGSGIAVQMATEFRVGAVILEAPYTSITDRGRKLYPYVPVHYILKIRFDSLSKIHDVHAPLLIMHGDKDEVIPVSDGQALYAAAVIPKELVIFPGTHHTDFDLQKLAECCDDFLDRHLKS